MKKNDNKNVKMSVRICEFVYLYVRIKLLIFLKKLYNKKFYLHLYICVPYN